VEYGHTEDGDDDANNRDDDNADSDAHGVPADSGENLTTNDGINRTVT
jgi:hypothetical protein